MCSMLVHTCANQQYYVYLIYVLVCYHLAYGYICIYICTVTHKCENDLYLASTCVGMDNNIDYQLRDDFQDFQSNFQDLSSGVCRGRPVCVGN